ncbi:MAG: hypothetical protein G8345_13120 [Magnetococcales bacterium]|nr:hypothetical protein [Magnetococcales bacterium]NGZ27814.1 hypothetical protein [Magnetococcales bacterium]
MDSIVSSKFSWPERIVRHDGSPEIYVVEDSNGQVMAMTPSARMARLIFAAPGMLDALGRLANSMETLGQRQFQATPRLLEEISQSLEDANSALNAAIQTRIA